MRNITIIAALMAATSGTSAVAQQFAGGTLGLEYSNFSDSDILGATSYFGAAELDVFGPASIALDLSGYNFNNFDENGTSAGIHGIYDLNNGTSVGLFLGRESVDEVDIDSYGVEGRMAFGVIGVEAYLGAFDAGAGDETMIGADGGYDFNQNFAIIGGFDRATFGDNAVFNIEAGGKYRLTNGPEFYATVGNRSTDDDDENFISLGAQINFGQNGGPTFNRRSVLDIVDAPG